MTLLKESYPNVGGGGIPYVHCPNCSLMYATRNDKDQPTPLPQFCTRCACPMEGGEVSQEFMDSEAVKHHDPAVAEYGRKYRGGGRAVDDSDEPAEALTKIGELSKQVENLTKIVEGVTKDVAKLSKALE